MASADKVRVILHYESKDQHTDVHSVVIGISCNNYVVVAEVVKILLHVQGGYEEVQFLVFRHFLAAFLEAVDGFSP